MRRRDALIIGGAMAVAIAIPPYLRHRGRAFEFSPIDDVPGFRRISLGGVSGPTTLFLGLGEDRPDLSRDHAAVRQDPCGALFRPGPGLPVAVFTDYNCPYCKILSRALIDRAEAGEDLALSWHELPLLGPSSDRAARVALAAGLQGKYLEIHARLMQGILRPGKHAMRVLAAEHRLDGERLLADVTGPEVEARLRQSKALAEVFGIPGTPGTVIGRTLALGAITPGELTRLIKLERREPGAPCGPSGA